MGHILNLSVNSFLWLIESDDLEQPINYTLEEDIETTREWRKRGPLGKLHNVVVHIQRSPQRLKEFKNLAKGCYPVRDNKTRWNSWSNMLEANTVSPRIEAIRRYIQLYNLEEDALSDEDWALLWNIRDFLKVFKDITLELEGHASILAMALPAMDLILSHYEKGMHTYRDHTHMRSMCDAGWRKMEKYYGLTDSSSAYVAAIVLNPSLKWDYIKAAWRPSWILPAEIRMRKFWEEHYKPEGDIQLPREDQEESATSSRLATYLRQYQPSRASITDEYEHYIHQETVAEAAEDPLKWWLQPERQIKYPNLSKMAMDILSIPAMADEPERVFSGAKFTITQYRNRLGMAMFRAFERIKSWCKLKGFYEGNAMEDFMFGGMDMEAFAAALEA